MRWWFLVLLLGASGCANFKFPRLNTGADLDSKTQTESRWRAHQRSVEALEEWRIEGRIAVQSEAGGGNARLYWQQRADAFDVRIVAPFGRGTFLLSGDEHRVSLMTPENEYYVADDVESLMARHLQWSLPLNGARYWVRGIPVPEMPIANLRLDDEARLSDLAQAGWRISILRYIAAAGTDLPGKIFFNHDEFKVRMVIAKWQVAPL